MEASSQVVRGNVDSLMRLLAALDTAGIEVINEGAVSKDGGRGVRLKVAASVEPLRRKPKLAPARGTRTRP